MIIQLLIYALIAFVLAAGAAALELSKTEPRNQSDRGS